MNGCSCISMHTHGYKIYIYFFLIMCVMQCQSYPKQYWMCATTFFLFVCLFVLFLVLAVGIKCWAQRWIAFRDSILLSIVVVRWYCFVAFRLSHQRIECTIAEEWRANLFHSRWCSSAMDWIECILHMYIVFVSFVRRFGVVRCRQYYVATRAKAFWTCNLWADGC